jgi:hypothetical protein
MLTRRSRAEALKLLQRLGSDAGAHLLLTDDSFLELVSPGRAKAPYRVDSELVRSLLSRGLLCEVEPGRVAASPEARAWLRRAGEPDLPFRAQHDQLRKAPLQGEPGTAVLRNLDESPVAALARRMGRAGQSWLGTDEVAAAERMRKDFEIAQLRPRITANWSASISTGRRTGDDLTDLTDMALSARRRFDRAIEAVGPEFSGVLIDICCFLKGLELVERERQWPARSAKLVLRLGLQRLARYYGLTATASGPPAARGAYHWGAEDYRPKIS